MEINMVIDKDNVYGEEEDECEDYVTLRVFVL